MFILSVLSSSENEIADWLKDACHVFNTFPVDRVLINDTQYDIRSLLDEYRKKIIELEMPNSDRLFYKILKQSCKC